MRVCWGGALVVLAINCATDPSPMLLPPVTDTPEFDAAVVKAVAAQTPKVAPVSGLQPICVVSCPQGFSMRRQHMCRSGQRWFQDAIARDRKTTRGADGMILTDVWVTDRGDYAAEDVEKGTCSTVIARIISMRAIEDRGQHPGEDSQGNPAPPENR